MFILSVATGHSARLVWEDYMKSIHSIIATMALAFVFPAAATAAVGDPELVLYRVTGINANGGQTILYCTPFSGVSETIRFVTRDANGTLVDNQAFTVTHLATKLFISTSPSPGTAAIAATSNQAICEVGISGGLGTLHPIRFNPISGAQE
jgi:hypothetical protein